MWIIKAALALTAIYSGGMWLWLCIISLINRAAYRARPDLGDQIERYTFHLGLCFILAAGFLGLILE